jgi:demethylmenaquinone methyltransferase/2-methoxy-6-polyprenyl-1,4-benzoquinol methylase
LPSGFIYGMALSLNSIYSRIYKRYDLINRLFTFGMDQKWRKYTAIQCIKEKPYTVLDLCCGTGDMAIMLSLFSENEIRITGYDGNQQMIEKAIQKSKQKGCRNIEYIQGDIIEIPFPENSFDCITISFGFRNLTYRNPQSDRYLSEIYRVLKNNGKLYILESGIPQNPFIRFVFKIYLYIILMPMGLIFSGSIKAYRYLAQSSAGFYTEEEIKQILMTHGFEIISIKKFFFGATGLTIASKHQHS